LIIGIGHDLADIGRVEQLIEGPQGRRFLERILTADECRLAQGKGKRLAEFAAGRFAAKEAVVKAFGCGIGKIIGFTDIEIKPDDRGKPCISLSDGAWERLGLLPATVRLHLTITHERAIASAFVVAEQA
jgi:holo-[acyl-carrier protein] synthase